MERGGGAREGGGDDEAEVPTTRRESSTTPAGLEDGERTMRQRMWRASRCWKGQGNEFSLEPPKAQRDQAGLQNYKIIHLCYFKPPNLW